MLSDGNCPENWIQGMDYNCYYFEKEEMLTWQAAQDRCNEMGGRLATIESWNEFYWMKGYRASDPLLRSAFLHPLVLSASVAFMDDGWQLKLFKCV